MDRPPRPRRERLLDRPTLRRVFGLVGPLEGLAGLASFFAAYALAGWRPWEPLASSGDLYVTATAMTCGGIVAAQVGAGLAMRTNRESVFTVGLLSNRLLVAGIAFELGLLAALLYVPALAELFHMAPLGPAELAVLLLWPPLVLGADEARKALARRSG
jgi:magnesium-transporting ATPase (P-type)